MANIADRKEAILAAAEAVFAANGYAATTMDAVASKAGIAKGSLYNYFQSKEALFEEVFTKAVSILEADALRILAEPISASERLSRFLDYRCERLEDSSQIGRLVLEFWATAAREQQGALATTLRVPYSKMRYAPPRSNSMILSPSSIIPLSRVSQARSSSGDIAPSPGCASGPFEGEPLRRQALPRWHTRPRSGRPCWQSSDQSAPQPCPATRHPQSHCRA